MYQSSYLSYIALQLYLGSLLENQNFIPEKIKCRVKAANSCYYSIPKLLPSRLFSKNLNIKIYKIIILPVVLCGCKTWSLILRFENTTLGQVFGPKRDDNGEWRRLHNEEIHNLYRSPNIVRVIKSKRLR